MPLIVEPKGQEPIEQKSSSPENISPETLDAGIKLENLETLNYLGLKDEMFNEDVIGKVETINEYLKSNEKDIVDLDLELGNPGNMTRLDKLYSYAMLEKQSQDILQKERNIQLQKLRYKLI